MHTRNHAPHIAGVDKTDALTDEPQNAKREAAKLARQVEANDVKAVMATPQGRRVVRRWLAAAGIHRSTFAPGAPDVSAYNEGRRALGLQIEEEVARHSPDHYLLMLNEGRKQ